MSYIPEFEIGIWNAWLFMIIYPLQWLAVLVLPKHVADSTSQPADFKQDRRGKWIGQAAQILWIVATLYSFFLPLDIGTVWFYVGLGVFVIGLVILVLATLTVVQTASGKIFSGGAYRFSRHPMYLSMIFVYLAVSIAAASWLFLLITVITFFLLWYQLMQEEKYCCQKFGMDYRAYMRRTPRWIGIPKSST